MTIIEKLNVGLAPDDGKGEDGRSAFEKIQRNIDALNLGKAEEAETATALASKADKDATETALATKVDKEAGMGLSETSFTQDEKDKLAGLESSHFRGLFADLAALQLAIPAGRPGDYADVDAGVGEEVARYIWDGSDSVWVQQGAPATPLTAAQVKQLYENNPDTNALTDVLKTKLEGVETGAQKNVATNLSIGQVTESSMEILSSTGTLATLSAVTDTKAGLMTAADKRKLDAAGEGAGESLFSIGHHNGPRSSIPIISPGRIAADGQTLLYSEYPKVCQAVWDGQQNAVEQSAWAANKNCWGKGDGTTYVTVPNLNMADGSAPPFYLRGGPDGLNGTWVGDAIRNITGRVTLRFAASYPGEIGALSAVAAEGTDIPITVGGTAQSQYYVQLDASKLVPTAAENRVKTAYMVYTVRIFNAVSNPTLIDVAVLAANLSTLRDRVLNTPSNRNVIINGAMQVAQRGVGPFLGGTGNYVYGADRFRTAGTLVPLSVDNVSTSTGAFGPVTWLRVTAQGGITSNDAGHTSTLYSVEGYDVARLYNRTFTLSFVVTSSKAGTHCVALRNTDGNVSFIKTYNIPEAGKVYKIELKVPGGIPFNSLGSWNRTNGIGLSVVFAHNAGANFMTATEDSWVAGSFLRKSGVPNVLTAAGDYWSVTNVQLEVGDEATAFEHRPYADELARCMRYFEVMPGTVSTTSPFYLWHRFKTTKRAKPTLTVAAGSLSGASMDNNSGSEIGFRCPVNIRPSVDSDFVIYVDAEL